MVVNDSKVQFDLSDLVFTEIRDIDNQIYEYEQNFQPECLEDNENKGKANEIYPDLFRLGVFAKYIKKEMKRRLASCKRSWQVRNITLATLVDRHVLEGQ